MIDGKNPNLSVYRVIYRRNTIMKVSDVNYFYGFGDWSDHIFRKGQVLISSCQSREYRKCSYPIERVSNTESAFTQLSSSEIVRITKALMPSWTRDQLSE